MSVHQHDFTKGNILKQLIAFSTPVLLANLLQTSYQFVDSLWIGNLLGADALGAVSISSVIVFTVLSFVIGMNNAALTILSQQKGLHNETGLIRYLNAFVVILFILSMALGLTGFLFSEQLLALMDTPESLLADARNYLQINFLGMLFLFGYNFISTVLRALGDSKTPMRFVFIAVILNIVIDPLFISTFGWGIQGAAFATIFSQGFAFLFGLFYVLKNRLAPFTWPTLPKWSEVKLILNLGIPSGLQMSVITAGSAAIMSVVTTFGGAVVGGFGAAQRMDSLVMLPAQALGVSVSSMAGQNIGRGNWNRVHRIARMSVLYNLLIMITIALFVVIFAEQAMKLFVREPEAVAFGKKYLRIIALCFPFLGINFVLNGIVRAAGAMYQVLILNLISFWALRYPLTALFAHFFNETGIAMGMGSSFILSSMIAFLYFRYGKWRKKQLFKQEQKATS